MTHKIDPLTGDLKFDFGDDWVFPKPSTLERELEAFARVDYERLLRPDVSMRADEAIARFMAGMPIDLADGSRAIRDPNDPTRALVIKPPPPFDLMRGMEALSEDWLTRQRAQAERASLDLRLRTIHGSMQSWQMLPDAHPDCDHWCDHQAYRELRYSFVEALIELDIALADTVLAAAIRCDINLWEDGDYANLLDDITRPT